MIFPEKYVNGIYQETKMSVKVKDVGSYKIHVKESTIQKWWAKWFFIIMTIAGAILLFIGGFYFERVLNPIIPICGGIIAILSLLGFGANDNVTFDPAYYVDTTMYGIGGKTIRKTTPEQDHIAICKVSHEFEMQILERIKKEEELKAIVGVCK
jgi:hypothetical protein